MKCIAIDGPAGAGKSTIAKAIAKDLGYIYADTGALYRTIALYVMDRGVDPSSTPQMIEAIKHINIDIKFKDGKQLIYLNNQDITSKLRLPNISSIASKVSQLPIVRDFLFKLQKNMLESGNIIMDGRDIGTVVAPNADIKIYLTATSEERADRRYKELKNTGVNITYNEVLSDIKRRDYNDMNRSTAPLIKAKDAILVETTGNELSESIDIIKNLIKERL